MQKNSVILLFFDLPSKQKTEKFEYRKFVKFLKSSGYVRIQESVFIKLMRNEKTNQYEIAKIISNLPLKGNISVLPLTIKEFSKYKSLLGNNFDYNFFSDDVLILKNT